MEDEKLIDSFEMPENEKGFFILYLNEVIIYVLMWIFGHLQQCFPFIEANKHVIVLQRLHFKSTLGKCAYVHPVVTAICRDQTKDAKS